ncbi:unnamed protein product [Discosporangium mesarthrocarpum]
MTSKSSHAGRVKPWDPRLYPLPFPTRSLFPRPMGYGLKCLGEGSVPGGRAAVGLGPAVTPVQLFFDHFGVLHGVHTSAVSLAHHRVKKKRKKKGHGKMPVLICLCVCVCVCVPCPAASTPPGVCVQQAFVCCVVYIC